MPLDNATPTIGGTMYVLDSSGHKNVMRWDETQESQDIARAAFNEYKRKHFSMFVMDEDDKKGRKLTDFDPTVRAFVAIAAPVGG